MRRLVMFAALVVALFLPAASRAGCPQGLCVQSFHAPAVVAVQQFAVQPVYAAQIVVPHVQAFAVVQPVFAAQHVQQFAVQRQVVQQNVIQKQVIQRQQVIRQSSISFSRSRGVIVR